MKGKFLFITILIIILGLHMGGLYLFIRHKKEARESKSTDSTANEAVTDKKKDISQNKPTKPHQPSKKSLQPSKNNKFFGKPFSYKKTVYGNIPKISASKNATAGILVDLNNRQVLWAKNPRKPMRIASMTKMMTMLIAMEAVNSKRNVSLDTKIKVTKTAYKIGGSQVWLDPRETFTLRDLLKSIAIKSANDCAELVAEFFGGGSSKQFVKKMNSRARELNMKHTKFTNPHGLPENNPQKDNVSSCEDLVFLSERLLGYPQVLEWSSTWLDYIRKDKKKPTMLTNHNRLVKSCKGVDGMKTGYTKLAKYCTTVTCKRGNRRLIAVVTGFPSYKNRDNFVKKLLDWGYSRVNSKK